MIIKRDPQEIADFFGGYVAQNRNGEWNLFYSSEPYIDDVYGTWEDDALEIYIDSKLIDVSEGHDWQTLYKPQPIDAIKVFKSIQERKNSAPHQSDVHVHSGYKTVTGYSLSEFDRKVNDAISEGWKPLSMAIFPVVPSIGTVYYMAMVRDVC